jgi:hypothetical protein
VVATGGGLIMGCGKCIEYELEAFDEAEAIERLTECILNDLDDGSDIRDIAEVAAERIITKE